MRRLLFTYSIVAALSVMAAPVKQISQYGITWKLDKAVDAGQFANGDWWVVGPVTVSSITPAPGNGRHGSVVNPVAGSKHGYDQRLRGFTPAMVVVLPLQLQPNQSLVSTISVEKVGVRTKDTVRGQYLRGPIQTAAVLTCLAKRPTDDTFRPGFCGTWKKLYRVKDLKLDRLPGVAPKGKLPDVAFLRRVLQRPWIDHYPGWVGRRIHPIENMPDYGRELTNIVSQAGLLLTTEGAATKYRMILIRYIQLGIDLFGTTQSNSDLWNADGGHCSGRKFPILFAGRLLDNQEMLNVKASFQEDQQPYFAKGYRGQTVLWRICLQNGREHEHLSPEKWAGAPFRRGNDGWKSENYRGLNGPTWIGQALAARLMKVEKAWNSKAYFAYVDRWVAEAPNGMVNRKTLKPKAYGPFNHPFVEQMWNAYRKAN